MKLLRAIVREDKLMEITAVLRAAGVEGITVTAAMGTGTTPHVGVYRGRTHPALVQGKVIELVVPDAAADDVVNMLLGSAHPGYAGDGHVMVIPIEARYSIRTRWRDVA